MKLKSLMLVGAATLGIASAVGFAATLAVGSSHLWAGSQNLTKGTCNVPSSAITDTYVNEASMFTSYSTSPTTLVRRDTNSRNWLFIRADLSSCLLPTTGGADTATLKLVVKTTAFGGRTLTVTPVLTTWSGSLTWYGAQTLSYGGATTTFNTGTTSGATLSIPVTVDVDALIKSPSSSFGWRIVDLGGTSGFGTTTTFNSAQATTTSLRPTLTVNYEK